MDLLLGLLREQEAIRISGKPQPLLGELLVQRGVLTEEQVKTILEKQQELGKREGELVHDADNWYQATPLPLFEDTRH